MGSTSVSAAKSNPSFLSPPVGELRVGSPEWQEHVRAKLDALEIPGTILDFSPEEAEYAGFVEEPAFEGCDLESEVEDAAKELVAQYMTPQERQAEAAAEMSIGTLLEELPADGTGSQLEDEWFV